MGIDSLLYDIGAEALLSDTAKLVGSADASSPGWAPAIF